MTLSQDPIAKQVQVAWSAPLATDAAEGTDLSATSGTVTFAANSDANATQTITITATDDMLSETAESFTVTLGAITSDLSEVSVDSSANTATATIAASDPITINISGPSTVNEGDTTTNYTVSLSPSGVTPGADLTVSYATARSDKAISEADFTAKSGTLTFTKTAAGSQTFTVQTTQDNIDEGTGENFTVTLSSLSGGGGSASLGTSSVTTTITDDDEPTDISLSVDPSKLKESDKLTTITVTATLNGSTRATPTVVTIGTLAGTATKGTDYTATTLASITIPANTASATGTFTITPTDDEVVEGNETITVSGTTTVDLGVNDAEITLTDHSTGQALDSAKLSISGPSALVDEGSAASFTVTLSKSVAAQVTVAWSATADTAEMADLDASSRSGTVTFAANSTANATRTITITATDDTLSETDETFTVTLGDITSTLSEVSVDSSDGSATATIAASDPIIVNISGPTTVDEGDTTTNYTVSLTGGTPTEDLTVSYATSDGTATAGSDYTAKPVTTLTFTPTAHGPQTFTIQTTEDTLDEGTGETFTVTISSPSGGGGPAPSLGTSKSVSTTITDDDGTTQNPTPTPPTPPDDPPPPDDPQFSIIGPSGPVAEGANAVFTVTLLTAITRDVTVAWSATPGTARSGDYSPRSGSVTFAAYSPPGTTRTITITATDDSLSEGAESFTVTLGAGTRTLSSPVSLRSEALSAPSASATISESDPITVVLSGPSTVQRGDAAVYTVSISSSGVTPTENLTVTYSTSDGTARAGTDYTAASGSVTFSQGSTGSRTFTVQTTGDASGEDATFSVALSGPAGGGGPAPSLGVSSITTTINDDPSAEDPNPDSPSDPTPRPVATPTPTATPAPVATPTPTATPTPDPSLTPSATPTPTATPTLVATPAPVATPTPGVTPTPDCHPERRLPPQHRAPLRRQNPPQHPAPPRRRVPSRRQNQPRHRMAARHRHPRQHLTPRQHRTRQAPSKKNRRSPPRGFIHCRAFSS